MISEPLLYNKVSISGGGGEGGRSPIKIAKISYAQNLLTSRHQLGLSIVHL